MHSVQIQYLSPQLIEFLGIEQQDGKTTISVEACESNCRFTLIIIAVMLDNGFASRFGFQTYSQIPMVWETGQDRVRVEDLDANVMWVVVLHRLIAWETQNGESGKCEAGDS